MKTLWLALGVAMTFSMAYSQPSGDSNVDENTATFLDLEKSWNEAHVAGNAEVLDKLWAEELTVIVPNMQVFDKRQSLAIWRSGHMRFDRYETSDIAVRVFGNSAVVIGRVKRTRTRGDKQFEDDWRFTKVYVHQQDSWRVVAWHASPA